MKRSLLKKATYILSILSLLAIPFLIADNNEIKLNTSLGISVESGYHMGKIDAVSGATTVAEDSEYDDITAAGGIYIDADLIKIGDKDRIGFRSNFDYNFPENYYSISFLPLYKSFYKMESDALKTFEPWYSVGVTLQYLEDYEDDYFLGLTLSHGSDFKLAFEGLKFGYQLDLNMINFKGAEHSETIEGEKIDFTTRYDNILLKLNLSYDLF